MCNLNALSDKSKIPVLNDMYKFLDDLSSEFRDQVKFKLEISTEPHRVSFESEDFLMYFENSWPLATYDFFLTDDQAGINVSESAVKVDGIQNVKDTIRKSLERLTPLGKLQSLKQQACIMIEEIDKLTRRKFEVVNHSN